MAPIQLQMPAARRALAEMFIDLCLAFHATTVPLDQEPGKLDANLAVVAVAAMLGHADGQPMTRTEIAARLHMSPTSAQRRLDVLVAKSVLKRIGGRYYLEPYRAAYAPRFDQFTLILSQAFAVLGPFLSDLDT